MLPEALVQTSMFESGRSMCRRKFATQQLLRLSLASATAASVVWLLALDFIFTRCVSPWPRISMLDVVQTEGLSDTGKARTCETRFQLTFRPQKWNLKAHMWYQLSPFPLPSRLRTRQLCGSGCVCRLDFNFMHVATG